MHNVLRSNACNTMKSKRYIVIVVTMIVIIMSGCSFKEQNKEIINPQHKKDGIDQTVKEDNQLATKEFLIETFSVSEEDIKRLDVMELVSHFQLTEESFLEEKEYIGSLSDICKVYENLKAQEEVGEVEKSLDYSYLIDAKEYKGEIPAISTIHYLAVSQQKGNGGISCFIDFEQSEIYYSFMGAGVYTNIQYAEQVVEMSAEEKNKILEALEKANINEWDYMYENSESKNDESWWHLGLEFNNNTVISFNGNGKTPNSYPDLQSVLFSYKLIQL